MNSLKKVLLLQLLILTITGFGQKNSPVFIKFDDENVSKAEFKRVYLKNNSGEMVSKSTVEEYLDLYINFKLKVKEAEAMGMDTISSFVSELDGYRKQLAQPYLTAEGIYEELKKEAYDRLQEDIKASHILISVEEDASPEDTMKAYKRISDIRKQIIKGENFELMAQQYSDDPSAKTNGGDLGYFTAFYMVYPFESAAYDTKKGEVSDIVRSQFGYHIIKVTDRRPAAGNIKVAHILISNDQELSKTDDPEGKINEIYKKIGKDASFEQLAAQFSDDTRSASQGGVIPTFGVGRMVPEFEKVAFSLEKDGEVSKPFQTPYGWHIVKRIEAYPIPSFKEVEPELMTRIKKDSRANLSQSAVINKIKKQYGFSENLKERNDFYKVIDSSYFKDQWTVAKAEGLNKTLFKIGDREVKQAEFAQYLERINKNGKVIDSRVLINGKYETFKNNEILEYKNSLLDDEYPEFANLMQEYHDGILLFNLTDKLVWSKAIKDSSGLGTFYENNKEDYKWSKRVDATVFSAANEQIASEVRNMLVMGKELKEILQEVNRESQLNLKYEGKKYQKGDNEFVDKVKWEKGISKNMKDDNRIVFVWINEVLSPDYKTLDDSRGLITSDYQNHLEKEWIKSLRKKYSYKVDNKVLSELKKELN